MIILSNPILCMSEQSQEGHHGKISTMQMTARIAAEKERKMKSTSPYMNVCRSSVSTSKRSHQELPHMPTV